MDAPPSGGFVVPQSGTPPKSMLPPLPRPVAKALAVYHPICLEHRVPQDLAVEVPRRLEVAMAAIDVVERDYPELLHVERRPPAVQMMWVRAVHDSGYVLRMSQKIATAKELPLHVTQTTQEEEMEDQSGVCAASVSIALSHSHGSARRQGHLRQRSLLGRRAPRCRRRLLRCGCAVAPLCHSLLSDRVAAPGSMVKTCAVHHRPTAPSC